jgi:hypothetical protein
MFKKISESSENDPEQLANTSENSPALSKCINSFLDSDVKKLVKNKLCFILCQDKAFEDKINC